jgi:hypothetical protein
MESNKKGLAYTFIKLFYFISMWYKFGFFKAWLIYVISYNIWITGIEKLFNFELAKCMDAFMFLEDEKTPNGIIACLLVEKVSIKEIKEDLWTAVSKFRRMKQIPVKVFNDWYWYEDQKFSDKDFILRNNFILIEDNLIKNELDLARFCEKEFTKVLPHSKPLYEIHFQENYSEDDSLIIFKYHHGLGDGTSLVFFLSYLCEDMDMGKYITNKKFGFIQKFLLYALSPYYLIRDFYKVYTNKYHEETNQKEVPKDLKHVFKKNEIKSKDLSGEIKLSTTKSYSFHKLRQVYKQFPNATFNDVCCAILFKAIHRYACDYEIESNCILGLLGYSTRLELLPNEMDNQSTAKVIKFIFRQLSPSKSSLADYIKAVQHSMEADKLRDKKAITASMFFFNIMAKYLMSDHFMLIFGENVFANVGFIFTNVRGPEKKIHLIGNKEVRDIYTFVPHGAMPFSLVSVTYNQQVKFGFTTDKNNNLNCELLSQYVNEEFSSMEKEFNLS